MKPNQHIPSARKQFGLHTVGGRDVIVKGYVSANYIHLPIGEARKAKIMDTRKLVREWVET